MNRRWICSDVWMDILPSFERVELGLKMALLSDRFDILVDKHFDGKIELTLWRAIEIRKDKGPKAKLTVQINGIFVQFPMPDRPLPIKIRFKDLRIKYIDHSVLAFLRSNKQIWDRKGTKLEFNVYKNEIEDDYLLIWAVLTYKIWPNFVTTIRHLSFFVADDLDNLRRRTSPTILTGLDQLNSINSDALFPDVIADDGPNATAGQALSKWLHNPRKDRQPKRLRCRDYLGPPAFEWINNFKETFLRANTSVSYKIQLIFDRITPTGPFEVVNERTNEKLILWEICENYWLLKRCPIGETATIQWKDENWDDNLNKVKFNLWRANDSIGPLSPPAGRSG